MPEQEFDPIAVQPGTDIGPYRVLRQLGRGGMGAVYQVERDGQPFALKLSSQRHSELDSEARAALEARVRREVAALAALHHPNVVRLHAFDRHPDVHGYLYLVMDLVEGLRLYAWQDKHHPSLRVLARVFRRIAEALQALHGHGVHHRDVKSANVLVRADDEPILIDFGIARVEGAGGLTRAGHLIGTATHVSPEYARHILRSVEVKGERYTFGPTDDLHATGVMLYEALTGRRPFDTDEPNEWALLKEIAHCVPQSPRALNPLVPVALDAVAMKLLAKQPEGRFQSGAQLAQTLTSALAASDASWDAPFERPQPQEKAPTRNGRAPNPAEADAAAEVDSLLLAELPAPAAPPAAVPPPVDFRVPTEPQKRFVPPEAPAHVASAPAPSAGGELPTAIRAMGHHLGQPSAAPRRLAVLGGSALAGMGLIAAILLTTPREAPVRPRTLLEEHLRAAPPGTPPPPLLVTPGAPPVPTSTAPPASTEPNARPPLPVQVEVREPPRRLPTLARSASPRTSRKPPADDTPAWLKGAVTDPPSAPIGPATTKLGVPFGAHIRARLKSDLDSRTVGDGLVEAVLLRPHVQREAAVLPSRTMLYGCAQVSGERFLVQFTRLTLPDGTEVAFKGSALDLDGKPGLAAGRRIHSDEPAKPGLPEALARTAAGALLGQVGGNPAVDAAGAAGRQLLEGRGPGAVRAGDVVLLDAGADFDAVVQESF